MFTKENPSTKIYHISQFITEAEHLLIQRFSRIHITGEISNLSCPSSGHLYFSLKDDQAQIRCAFFKGYNRHLDFQLKEGMQILIKGTPAIYASRGDFQIIVEQLTLAGEGLLRQAFEKLKNRLKAEGLFDDTYKKPCPFLPKRIGVITSSTGAAIQDVLHVLKRRFSNIPVIIYPVSVQGVNAAPQIVHMIQKANQDRRADVLMLVRGGGSLEDLWAFNEESVARAIFDSKLPIVTGIGHEVDFTIADFVSDVRAPTPSAAAEIVLPEKAFFYQRTEQLLDRLKQLLLTQLNQLDTHLNHLRKRLQHPETQINYQLERLNSFKNRLDFIIQNQISFSEQRLNTLKQRLHTVSPLNTLERGYAIALHGKSIITDPQQVNSNDEIQLKLAKGELKCKVL